MPQKLCQIAVESLHLNFTKINSKFLAYIIQLCQSVNEYAVVHLCTDPGFAFIIFIQDISYDLLQNIFHCDNTGGLPILIYYNGHMLLSGLHSPEQFTDIPGLRHKSSFADQTRQFFQRFVLRPGIFGHEFQCILIMDQPLNIVHILSVDRIPGISLFQHSADHAFQKIIQAKRYYCSPVGHHRTGFRIVKSKYVLDHLCFILLKYTLFMSLIHHRDNFFFCYCILFFTG